MTMSEETSSAPLSEFDEKDKQSVLSVSLTGGVPFTKKFGA
jgi:hypothetical protein